MHYTVINTKVKKSTGGKDTSEYRYKHISTIANEYYEHTKFPLNIHLIAYMIVFFNLRLECAYVFHKSSLKICLKYAYLRTFKRENFMILPTLWGKELVEVTKVKRF